VANLNIIKFEEIVLNSFSNNSISGENLIAVAKKLIDYTKVTNDSLKKMIDDKIKNFAIAISGLNTDLMNSNGELFKRFLKFISYINKYGKAISNIANAQNSDELKIIIKNYVLPSGSYAIQRTSLSTFTIATHVGVNMGVEANGKWNHFAANIGLTVPIGFELTRGRKSDSKTKYQYLDDKGKMNYLTGASRGLFLQVFDIAAVVNYRLTSDTGSLPQKILLKQIFSPGLSYNFGIKNSPFDIGIGIQYTPDLRKIGNDLQANSYRFFIRFSWSKPLIPLYISRETKKKTLIPPDL
jgi:hypothetical protein